MTASAVARSSRTNSPTVQALAARAAGKAAARERRAAARNALVNPETPTLVEENFLTEFQFAAAVGKDIRSVRRWRAQRVGPPWTKLGRLVLYPKDNVLAYLKEQAAMKPCRSRRGVSR